MRLGAACLESSCMIIFLTIIHVIVSLVLIAVILLQQGKSADLAGAFGGQGSQTAFGPRGAANMLTRFTTWGAIIFMVTSIALFVLIGKHAGGGSVLDGTTTAPIHQQAPAPTKK
jgi:preprotein translocase subunit SecG